MLGSGRVTANGGNGATGENTNGNDRVGGGGGGGSGGHVILATSSLIDMGGSDILNPVVARGGEGALGQGFTAGGINAGGQGGPGVIQFHVDDPDTNLIPPGVVDATVDDMSAPEPEVLLPFFNRRSRSRSIWIPLGGIEFGAISPPIQFLFDGTNTGTGLVPTTFGSVDPVVEPLLQGLPIVSWDGDLVKVDASALAADDGDPSMGSPTRVSNDIYLRNPGLLARFGSLVAYSAGAVPPVAQFDVISAYREEGDPFETLTLQLTDVVDPNDIDTIIPVAIDLTPRYFRVLTNDTPDSLPDPATMMFEFQGTSQDINGEPNEEIGVTSPWVTDITGLTSSGGLVQFLRFRVTFDVGPEPTGNSPKPETRFIRMPFWF
jgi:hypothetical protein